MDSPPALPPHETDLDRDSDTLKEEEPRFDHYIAHCHICSSILAAFSPAANDSFVELGTVQSILSGECSKHHNFVLRLLDENWRLNGQARQEVSIFRPPGGTRILIFLDNDTLYPPLELVRKDNDQDHPGQGRILDDHWIDSNLPLAWKRRCDQLHGVKCQTPPFSPPFVSGRPSCFINVQLNCLVPAQEGETYIALSYVWGGADCFMTQKGNVEELRHEGAFTRSDIKKKIPQTIRDAMHIVRLLEEKYLWVDCLCIIQDDNVTKRDQIHQMAAIYAGASITVVAAEGEDADHGLHGFRGATRPRQLQQDFFEIAEDDYLVEHLFCDETPKTSWYERGWTFQEHLYSQRLLVFEKQSIRWDCHCCSWFEDIACQETVKFSYTREIRQWQHRLNSVIPDLGAYGEITRTFNQRRFTYPEDSLNAIAGMTSMLSQTFQGGFLCGLPELFWDVSLLWQPWNSLQRRVSTARSNYNAKVSYLPSWSWVGWQGELDPWPWHSGYDYIKRGGTDCVTSRQTFPILQWYSNDEPKWKGSRQIASNLYAYKKSHSAIETPPSGWTRHDIHANESNGQSYKHGFARNRFYFYTNESVPEKEYWYPIPLRNKEEEPVIRPPARFLLATAQRTWLYPSNISTARSQNVVFSLCDISGVWVGILRLHNNEDGTLLHNLGICELFAISCGCADNSMTNEPGMEEWELEERPKTTTRYEFYNVLWVGWNNGIAHRRGLGRVMRDAWERQNAVLSVLILS